MGQSVARAVGAGLARCDVHLSVLLVAGTTSEQPLLDEKGRIYPCLPNEPNCALPPVSPPLRPGLPIL
jgi:hypothetical protein